MSPDPTEARRQAFDVLADTLGLDEFQRIAAWDLLKEEQEALLRDGMPAPGSEREQRLISLGALVMEGRLP